MAVAQPEVQAELQELASDFASRITARIGRIIPTPAELGSLVAGGDRGYVIVGTLLSGRVGAMPLTIGGEHRLDLKLKYHCCWDRSGGFLAIQESWAHVTAVGKDRTPLFRFEYVRDVHQDVPCAHLQVHAHRDEVTFLMLKSQTGRPAERRRHADRVPRFAEIHFPLGGHRFRPCLEDLLHMLVVEFGIDRKSTWRAATEEGREEWRRLQLKAAVRDAPEDAAAALRLLGYTVTPSQDDGIDRPERLRAY